MGSRKYDFTEDIADIICDRLMDGESLRAICRDPEMPAKITVLKWLAAHPHFATQYARARDEQADSLFDEMVDIANTPQQGIKVVTRPGGTETTVADMIEHRKLQIDTRKWVIGKLRPKKYGDVGRGDQPQEGGKETVVRVEGALPGEFEDSAK
jgi:hypothetical protein